MGAGHDLAKGKKRASRRHEIIRPGNRVWIICDNQLEWGVTPGVVEAVVNSLGREIASNRRIYNCMEISSKRTNILVDKNQIRPRTRLGKAELFRLVVNSLNERSHHHQQVSNSCLDLIGVYLLEIADLEGK